MLTGSLVAIATPMGKGGSLDLPVLGKLIDFHVANGTAGIVVVGTTGESPTVDVDEHCLLIKAAVQHARGRIPDRGRDGREFHVGGHRAHGLREGGGGAQLPFRRPLLQQADAGRPVSALPRDRRDSRPAAHPLQRAGRTVADLANDTVLRLAQVPGIVGIKDATADLGRGSELVKALAAAKMRDFAIYSGDDITGLPLLLMGGHGVISVTANVAPKLMAEMCKAAQAGDIAAARACNDRLLPLHRNLFVEANPIPVKWALAEMGMIENELRLPLVPLSPQHHEAVRAALREAGCA